MTIILPEELKRKEEEVRKYILPNGDWMPNTPKYIEEYLDEVERFYLDNMDNSF